MQVTVGVTSSDDGLLNWGDMSMTSHETQHPSDDGLGLGVADDLSDEFNAPGGDSEDEVYYIQYRGD